MPLDENLIKLVNERIMLEVSDLNDRLTNDIEAAVRAAHARRNTAGILPDVFSLCEQAIKDWAELICTNLLGLLERVGIGYSEELATELKRIVDQRLPHGVYRDLLRRRFDQSGRPYSEKVLTQTS